jgi:hypothetical protein
VPCPNVLEAMSPLFSPQFAPMDAMGNFSMSTISTLVAQCSKLQLESIPSKPSLKLCSFYMQLEMA